jgi:hypothetical protein
MLPVIYGPAQNDTCVYQFLLAEKYATRNQSTFLYGHTNVLNGNISSTLFVIFSPTLADLYYTRSVCL